MNKQDFVLDKKRLLREVTHLTRPARLEGGTKNRMMNPMRKKKKASRSTR